MSRARHRRPRPVLDFFFGLWVLYLLSRYNERRARRQEPTVYQRAGLTMADAIAAATTSYPVVDPCPWGLSAGACERFHPVNHVSRYAQSAGTTTAL